MSNQKKHAAEKPKEEPLRDLWSEEGRKSKKKRAAPPTPVLPPSAQTPVPLSYHPSDEEHQATLAKAVALENKRLVREQKAAEKAPVIRPLNVVDYQLDTLQKMLRGETEEEEDPSEAGAGEDDTPAAPPKRKAPERLTQAQRNRKVRVRQLEQQLEQQRRQKKIDHEASQVGKLAKEAKVREKALQERLARRKALRAELPKKVGPFRMEAQVPVPLSDEIPADLRGVRAPASLLKDRLRLKEEKGLIEARCKVHPHRKYRLKIKKVDPVEDFLRGRGVDVAELKKKKGARA